MSIRKGIVLLLFITASVFVYQYYLNTPAQVQKRIVYQGSTDNPSGVLFHEHFNILDQTPESFDQEDDITANEFEIAIEFLKLKNDQFEITKNVFIGLETHYKPAEAVYCNFKISKLTGAKWNDQLDAVTQTFSLLCQFEANKKTWIGHIQYLAIQKGNQLQIKRMSQSPELAYNATQPIKLADKNYWVQFKALEE